MSFLLLTCIIFIWNNYSSEHHQRIALPICFANPKWKSRLGRTPERKLWEIAILFTIRDCLRSRDIWVVNSRAYRDTRKQLLATKDAEQTLSLSIPLRADEWIEGRKSLLELRIKQVSHMIRQNTLPNSCIEKGKIHVNRLDPQIPEDVDTFTLDIYKNMPQVSVTDIAKSA